MESWQIIGGLGVLMAMIGGGLATIGTTSVGLFLFYGVLLVAGLGLVSVAKKQRDSRS